jgi:hypothetical protein
MWRASTGLMLLLLTSACASEGMLRDPVPEGLVNQASVENLKSVRFWGVAPATQYRAWQPTERSTNCGTMAQSRSRRA